MTNVSYSVGVDIGFASLTYLQIAILGIIQGITELLPISSTAHMRIVPALLGWRDPGSAFSATMQLAALAAVVSYFWRDIAAVGVGSAAAIRRRDFNDKWFRLAISIIIATIPICLVGVALSSTLNASASPLRSLWVIGVASLTMSVLLLIAEVTCRHQRIIGQARFKDAFVIGIAQIGALIPGVSRSGATLTAAMYLNFKREEAARLSFLLGLPAIALAGLKELWVLYQAHIPAQAWSLLMVGLLVASGSAFVTIWGLMRFLERFSSWPFIVYRAALGLFLISAVLTGFLG